MVLDDTHPDVRRAQVERLRQMTVAERFAMVEDLTRSTVRWSREAVGESMPGASAAQVLLRWIELVYGPELALGIAPTADRLGEPSAEA